jgi:hypothetical protein
VIRSFGHERLSIASMLVKCSARTLAQVLRRRAWHTLLRHRAAEVDASYAAYDEHPLDEPDEWGDLASFRRAAAAS